MRLKACAIVKVYFYFLRSDKLGDSSENQELKTILENAWHDLSSILTAVEVYTADLKEALPVLRESYQAAVSHNLLDNKQMDFDKIIDIESMLTEVPGRIQDIFKDLERKISNT